MKNVPFLFMYLEIAEADLGLLSMFGQTGPQKGQRMLDRSVTLNW